jgi:adenosylcobinamide kinase/adenosylcobinamide-phosphate guanylyltransferase
VLAEELAATLGGDSVLYVATALANRDEELERRVLLHRGRRPEGWGTLELGGGDLDAVLEDADRWGAVLLDSLTLWVSARMLSGEDEEASLEEFENFLVGAVALETPLVLVSDEVGLGIVPESDAERAFRDLLGLANQRVTAVAEEVHLCVAGIGVRIK